jgi:hypothetical protein
VQVAIRLIEHAEAQRFQAPRAFRKDDGGTAIRLPGLDEARKVLDAILTVRVHDDDRVGVRLLGDVCQPDGDGTLVPEVPPQRHERQWPSPLVDEVCGGDWRNRAIVDDHESDFSGVQVNDSGRNHGARGRSVPEHRHQDVHGRQACILWGLTGTPSSAAPDACARQALVGSSAGRHHGPAGFRPTQCPSLAARSAT